MKISIDCLSPEAAQLLGQQFAITQIEAYGPLDSERMKIYEALIARGAIDYCRQQIESWQRIKEEAGGSFRVREIAVQSIENMQDLLNYYENQVTVGRTATNHYLQSL